jgi:hypothetical protein
MSDDSTPVSVMFNTFGRTSQAPFLSYWQVGNISDFPHWIRRDIMSKIIRQAQVGLAVSAFALLTSHAAFAAAVNFRLPARQMHFASPQIHVTAPAVHLPLSNPNVGRTPVLQHFNLNTSTGFAHSTNSSNANTTPVGTRSNGGDLPRNNSGTTTSNNNNGQTGSGTSQPVSGTNTAGGNISSASVCATGYTLGANGMCQRGNGGGINLATGLSVPGPNGGETLTPPHIQIPIVTIYYTRLQQIANNAAAAANAAEAAKTSAGEATDTAEDANQAAEDAQKAAIAAQQAANTVCAEAVSLAYDADDTLVLNSPPDVQAINFAAMNAELGNCAQARQAQLAAQAAAAAAQLAANAATAQAQAAATAYAWADKWADRAAAATTPAAAEAAAKAAKTAAQEAAQDVDYANTENMTAASQAGKADQAAATATTAEQANPYQNAPVFPEGSSNGPTGSNPGNAPIGGPGGSPGSPGGGSPGGGSSGNGGSGGGSSGDLGSGGTPATGSDGG